MEEEIRYSINSGNLLMTGVALRHKAIMLRQAGHPVKDVIPLLKQSISILTACGHQVELANAKMELAREYIREGNTKKAVEHAEPAVRSLYSYNETLVPDDIRTLVRDLCHTNNLIDEIINLSQELITIRDSRVLFNRIISTINRITGAERGAIFVMGDNSPEQIVLRSAKNLTAEDVVSPQFQESMKLIEETARTGRARVNEPCVRHPAGGAIGNEIRSCICVPLTMRDKLVGVLYHDNRLFSSAFRESDLKILHYFAAQAAIAMDNAEAWRRLQKLYEQEQLEKRHYEKEYLGTIHFDGFVGKSPAIRRVFAQAEQVAQTDTTVLILGETGVGKELVARSIHRNSSRSHKPFIRVHCSALPESLISTELFGHEKGAFTGATAKKIGRFELANGGTIFLDEIGDISMDIQIKLLRVLQSKEYEKDGGNETLQSDFRLIAATNRNFEQEVENGRYRRDLYYRLKVFPITVPPLRARRADIEPLSYYFLNLYAKKFNKPLTIIPLKELERLQRYEWPGNVRELENVIERGVILSTGKSYITPELDNEATPADESYISLKENERNHILRVLRQTNGKVTGSGGASEILAIHPNTLFSRMKKLGISRKARYTAKNLA